VNKADYIWYFVNTSVPSVNYCDGLGRCFRFVCICACAALFFVLLPYFRRIKMYNPVKSQPFFKLFFTRRFLGKFAVEWLLKNPIALWICCHTTLWNITARKQATNDKLQDDVATYMYLKRGGLLITKLRKVYCWVCRRIFGKVTSKNVVVSCTLCAWPLHC